MQTLRAAIVGTGFMGYTHTEALRRMSVEVRGVLGAGAEASQGAARRLQIPTVYGSFDELCSDPAIDVVHLCTPNYLHYPMARQAFEAGKHVICEKPLANTAKQAHELIGLARQHQLVGAVNYCVRYYPMNQEARARIQAGEVGDPYILRAEYCQDWLFLPTDWNWRLDPEEGGTLRVVGDIGTHVMDMLTWLSGQHITAVMADLATFIPIRHQPKHGVETFSSKLQHFADTRPVEIRTEDYATILLRFSGGGRGSLVLSQVSAGRKNNFWWEINGSKASLSWRQERPNEMWIGHREKPNELLLKDPSLMQPATRQYAPYPGGHAEGYPDTFLRHFEEVYGYIAAGDYGAARTFPTLEDGWRELLLCEAIERSAAEQRWVDVDYA